MTTSPSGGTVTGWSATTFNPTVLHPEADALALAGQQARETALECRSTVRLDRRAQEEHEKERGDPFHILILRTAG